MSSADGQGLAGYSSIATELVPQGFEPIKNVGARRNQSMAGARELDGTLGFFVKCHAKIGFE